MFAQISSRSRFYAVCAVLVISLAGVGALAPSFYFVGVVAALIVVPIAIRAPLAVGCALIIAGPLLLPTFSLGGVTADNITSASGSLILAVALTRRVPALRLQGAVLLPAGISTILLLSIFAHGPSVLFNIARFIGVLLLVMAFQLSNPDERAAMMRILNGLMLASALVIVAQPLTNWPAPWGSFEGEGMRFGGLFGHPNFAAYTLGLFALYQTVRSGPLKTRIALLLPSFGALMLSGSRTAIIVFAAILCLALILRPRGTFPFFAGALVLGTVFGGTFASRFEGFLQTGGFSGTANAGGWRLIQWHYALDLAPNPNIWGIGWGMSDKFLPLGLGVHNGFLQFYVETGIVGCALLAITVIMAISTVIRSIESVVLWIFAVITTVFDPVLMYPACVVTLVALLSQLQPSHRSAVQLTHEEIRTSAPIVSTRRAMSN